MAGSQSTLLPGASIVFASAEAGLRLRYFGESHAAYRNWSRDGIVSKRNVAEMQKRRLEIQQRTERSLKERGELTDARLHAVNQARFEIAKQTWASGRAAAL